MSSTGTIRRIMQEIIGPSRSERDWIVKVYDKLDQTKRERIRQAIIAYMNGSMIWQDVMFKTNLDRMLMYRQSRPRGPVPLVLCHDFPVWEWGMYHLANDACLETYESVCSDMEKMTREQSCRWEPMMGVEQQLR